MDDHGVNPDWGRRARVGVPEAVYCAGKTPEQIARIVALAEERRESILLTRLDPGRFDALPPLVKGRLDYDPLSATAWLDNGLPGASPASIGIVCAGTSDLPVATESRRTLAFHGIAAPLIADVGVAGLWRLTERVGEIADWRVVIAVAGMEGALFSVVAGLVPGLVIAVPTSVGHGIAAAGQVALQSALASCAPGIVVVNVDGGFSAACAAIKALRVGAESSTGD